MSQGPNAPQKRCVPRIFRRQNSFAGFPSASLSIFSGTNDPIDTSASSTMNNATLVTSPSSSSSFNVSRSSKLETRNAAPAQVLSNQQNYASDNHNSSTAPTMTTFNPPPLNSQNQNFISKTRKNNTKIFYSLPRHATTPSNPSLLKESSSGLGLYLMSRNAKIPNKTSAVEKLGVSPAKFLSLPRPVRKQPQGETTTKSLVYRSLPRPHSKSRQAEMFSLPPSETKVRSSSSQINPKKITRDPADGREADPKPRRRDYETLPSSRPNIKENDSLKQKDDIKIQTPQSQVPKENDPKYHPRSRTVVKNDNWTPLYPKREDNLLYSYRRIGNEDYFYQPIIRPPEKDFFYFYPQPLRPPEPCYNYRSFPRTDKGIHAYQAMYRRPDGNDQIYPFIPRQFAYEKYIRPEIRPIHDPYFHSTYPRNYNLPPPPYQPYHPVVREPPPPIMTTYQPPPPLLPKGINKPDPIILTQYNKPVIEDIKYQSLPRKVTKEADYSYQSLPRRFGKENELRFFPINNIEGVDSTRYEDVRNILDETNVKIPSKPQEQIKGELNNADGKENEPQNTHERQLTPRRPDVVADLTAFTFPEEPYEPHYQTLPSQDISESKKSNSLPSKRQVRDRSVDTKYQSLSKRREESKYVSLSRKSPKYGESKYQSLPKRKLEKEKDYDRPPPPLPKRVPRDGLDLKNHSSHLRKSSKERESESRYLSNRRTSREGETRSAPARKISPSSSRSCPRRQQEPIPSSQQPPRSPRWTHPDTDDEDGIYSTVKAKEDPVYQSVPEITYTRPLPPVPAPSRYRRRPQDEEAPPPPLPPPRLTTGPVGPHNPLLNSSITNTNATSTIPLTTRPQILRTPSSSPENVIHKLPSPTVKAAPKEKEDDELYSSIPSPVSSSQDSPSLPRATLPPRVTSSASWDSLGSSVGSSGGSSRNSSLTSSTKENISTRRRRRAVSDPRMDAGVLHRLAFTVWHTALHIEKEVRKAFTP